MKTNKYRYIVPNENHEQSIMNYTNIRVNNVEIKLPLQEDRLKNKYVVEIRILCSILFFCFWTGIGPILIRTKFT